MKTRIITSALVAASLLVSGGAWAQSTPDARKLALTKEYMELAQVTKMMNTAMGAMAGGMNLGPDVPPQISNAMKESIVETTAEVFPAMMDRMAIMYAEVYSIEELEAIVAFFKSPAGRSMTVKTEQIMGKAVTVLNDEFGAQLQRDMMDRFCVKISCTPQQKAEIMKRLAP